MTGNTFLNSLSPDTVPNLLRMLSDRPSGTFWRSGSRFKDLHCLYLGEGALSESVRQLFPVISNLTQFDMFYEGRVEDHLSVLSDKKILAETIHAGGPHITEISLQLSNATEDEVKMLLSCVRHNCRNLQELHVSIFNSLELLPILRFLPGQLSSLSLHARLRKSAMEAIAAFNGRLRKLRFMFSDHDMEPLLAAQGCNLECLEILGMTSSPNFLRKVEKNCPNLDTLKIAYGSRKARSALVAFVVSDAIQLKNFVFGYSNEGGWYGGESLSLVHYQEISDKCSALKCSVSSEWD